MTGASEATREWTLAELAEIVGGDIRGNRAKTVRRIAEFADATPDSITHCSSPAQIKNLKNTQAGIVILRAKHLSDYEGDSIVSSSPRLAFAKVVNLFHPPDKCEWGMHGSAIVGENCQISSSATVGANVVIGHRVEIGANAIIGANTVIEDHVVVSDGTRIGPNSTIYRRTTIGKSCRFSAAVVLGAPGFSFEWDQSRWVPIRNIGSLRIDDDVDLGACTSIDRASIGETRIHKGVRIDNNCHIGHNVEIGEHTLIVANTGIGGSAVIGKRCVVGGQVAVKDNITVADDVVILGTSLVSKSITTAGTYSSAVPAREVNKWNRTLASLNHLNNRNQVLLRNNE